MDLKYTSLHEHDLHLHWHDMRNLRVAGYGGANIWTPGIPERYVVPYGGSADVEAATTKCIIFSKPQNPISL